MPPPVDPSSERAHAAGRPSPAGPLAVFAAVAVAAGVAGSLSFHASGGDLRRQKERELATIAALKVDELRRWRDERLLDAESVASDPTLLAAMGVGGAPSAAAARQVEAWFGRLSVLGEYEALAVVSASGAVRLAAGDVHPSSETISALVRDALRHRRPVLSDVHRLGTRGKLHLSVAAPLGTGTAPSDAIVLRIDPYRGLFRMIQSWPTPSETGEVLLVRRDGDRVAFANEPRHAAEGEPWSAPAARSDDLAVRALAGERGIVEGVDHHREPVLAAILPVEGTAWTLVAKVSAGEALARITDLRCWIVVGVLAVIVAAAAALAHWWRSATEAFERSRLHDAAERGALARRIERLTRYAADMVILTDDQHRILEVNERTTATLGYDRDELIGKSVRDVRDPSTLPDFQDRVEEQVARGAAVFETRFRRKDGTTFPVEVSAQAETVEGRRFFHGIVRDLTERKRAEEALRASEAKFRAVFEFATVGILVLDAEGRLVETNRAVRKLLGRDQQELQALGFRDLNAAADRTSADAVLGRMRDGAVTDVELPRRLLRKDGSLAETIVRASALRDESGAFRFALAVIEDVTEKKRLEAQLMLADRMASLGTLAAGVAHEINNPLSFILANVEFAAGELSAEPGDPEVLRALQEARDGGLRVREIVRDLKAFSRASSETRSLVDPRAVLRSALGLAQHEIRHRALLEVTLGDVPLVGGSEHRLGQVFLNLLINAAQAITEGRPTHNVIRARTSTAPDGRASVEISDTGSGIPADVLPRIFDPFFTTKPVGVGTGLGLSICHGIVTGLGGEIQVDSTPGHGSTFRVLLPSAHSAERSPAREEPAPAVPRRGRILVVDDEALVVRAVARVLAPLHEVVSRTSPRGALDDVAGGQGFDLVLCDLMMPEMTGMELHARFREIAPALADRTVFLTGGAFAPDARDFLERVPNARIEKPFEPEALRALVARVLAEPVAAPPPAA